jgi:hypothetical protein
MHTHWRRSAAAITLAIGVTACAAPASPSATTPLVSVPSEVATPGVPAAGGLELVGVTSGGLVLEPLIELDGAEPPSSPAIGTAFVVVQRTDDALLVLPPGGSGASAAWIAAETDDGGPTVEAARAPCPPGDPAVADLIALGGLARFCALTVAFDGYVPELCGIAGGVPLVTGTPEWLYGAAPSLWIYAEVPADPIDQANPPDSGVLAARVPPAIPVVNCDPDRARRWYAFTAHFDDPAAATCRATWSGRAGPVAEPPAVAEAACRMILVIDSARPIPAP